MSFKPTEDVQKATKKSGASIREVKKVLSDDVRCLLLDENHSDFFSLTDTREPFFGDLHALGRRC